MSEEPRAYGKYPLGVVEALIQRRDGSAVSRFKNLWLTSAFQPIFSLSHGRAVGYEALLRAQASQGTPISPLEAFAQARTESEVTLLDRLCRALHLSNYEAAGADTGWLFLNISPEVVVHGKTYGSFFSDLLSRHGFPAHRVVVEILEDAIRDESQLAEAVEYYRQLGCLVAIDDFGSGQSNFARIWRLAPDIVKLDRSVIVQATSKRQARRILPGLVSLIHEAGCLVLMEGIETEAELFVAMDADVDFVQGYFFGKPAERIYTEADKRCIPTALCDKFKSLAAKETKAQHDKVAVYVTGFQRCVAAIEAGMALETACIRFLFREGVERCYLLDAQGVQIGANVTPSRRAGGTDPKFGPLEDASGARWFRRPYFRRAIDQPGRIAMSRPYLSITGAHMCVTLSVAMRSGGETRVLCCDLNWESIEG